MKKQNLLCIATFCIVGACASLARGVIENPADILWEGYVNVTDGERLWYNATGDYTWTLNENAGGNPANVTYSGFDGLCILGYYYAYGVTTTLTIQTTQGAPGVINYIGRPDPAFGIRLGHTDDTGILNIESGNTLMVNNIFKYTGVPISQAIVNINDGQVFCYGDTLGARMSGITVNITPNGSLRIKADIASVYDQATYTAYTVGSSDGIGGVVNASPGSILTFANGGDYMGAPTVLITAAAGAPYFETQPDDVTVSVGETAVFTLSAINSVTGDATGLHYNWYEYVDGISDIQVGTDAPTLSLPGVDLSDDGKQYYCNVFNESYTISSELAYLTVRRIVAHWQFEDNMVDIVAGWTGEYVDPNVLHPTPTPVYNPAGIDGKAFEFSVDPPTFIRVINSNDGSFDFYPYGLTVSCWIKSTQPQTEIYTYPILYGNPSDASGDTAIRGWAIQNKTDSEIVGGRVFGVDSTIYTPALTTDEWHMITLTHAGGTAVLYADGERVGSFTDTTPTFSLIDSLLLMGALPNGVRSFNGLLDDVRIYNYPLNAFEVATLYTDLMPGATICAEPVVNDLNGDCIVDLLDFAEIAAAWLICNEVPTCLTLNPQ